MKHRIIFIFLFLSLVNCNQKEAPTSPLFFDLLGQHEENKAFKKGTFTLFLNFPNCFQEEHYNEISITHEFNYSCSSPHTLFAVDLLTYDELYSFIDKNKKPDSTLLFPNEKNQLLSTVVSKRLNTLSGGIHSEISSLLLNNNKLKFSTVICEGFHGNSYQPLTYYYAYIPIKRNHILFQFVCESEHFYALQTDFNRLLSSLTYLKNN